MKSVLILLLVGTLQASQFTASYAFDDNYSLTASFNGNLNGNVITGIRDLSVNVAGSWWDMNEGPECLTWERSYTYDGANHLTEGDAVMTLDGSFMNFCFGTFNETDEDWWDRNVRWAAHTATGMTALYHYQAGSNWTWDASRWSVEVYEEQPMAFSRFLAVTPSRVPDGGSVAALMATALAGLVAVKRRVTTRLAGSAHYRDWIGSVYSEYARMHGVAVDVAEEMVNESRYQIGKSWALGRSAHEAARRVSAP